MSSFRNKILFVVVWWTAAAVAAGAGRGVFVCSRPFVCPTEWATQPPELPLPEVPVLLLSPESRAAYVVEHFWDAMDFKDISRSRDRDFMEQNFVNYISLFPLADTAVCRASAVNLLRRAEADAAAYRLLVELAEQYLYDAGSPMLNETCYTWFLEEIVCSKQLKKSERIRPQQQLEVVRKNREGTPAADFAYETPDGQRHTLYGTTGEYILLLFYDPTCEHCKETIDELRHDAYVALHTAGGRLRVLAVCVDVPRETWLRQRALLPADWTAGFDADGVIDGSERYVLRAMPSLYLLDSDKKVLLKDVPPAAIIRFCARM